jgi:hypothetical protein
MAGTIDAYTGSGAFLKGASHRRRDASFPGYLDRQNGADQRHYPDHQEPSRPLTPNDGLRASNANRSDYVQGYD